MPKQFLQIDPKDNIIVAISDLGKGAKISVNNIDIVIQESIKSKHKFALKDLNTNDKIYMYGVLVGIATRPIKNGSLITIKNVQHASSEYAAKTLDYTWKKPSTTNLERKTFMGYHRKDGSVGTSNNWLVIPMVFCENKNIEIIEEAMSEALGYKLKQDYNIDTHALIYNYKNGASEKELYDTPIISNRAEIVKNRTFPNVDGLKFLRHDGGCGGTRQDSDTLCRLIAGYITNANVAGATILSLGCQHAEIRILKDTLSAYNPNFSKPVFYIEQQKTNSQQQFIEEAIKHTFIGLTKADKIERKPAPLSKLVLGLECGGSDGFSGISANPALGHASDLLVSLGGSTVLSEFPELNGVEQELINRCTTKESAEKFAHLMKSYSKAAIAVGSGFKNNPSPGNINDGLITDAMKSAGAAKKGGTSPVVDVLDYTEQINTPGLNLLCTPGNDVESTTGLAGSGCNIIVFTTGLGTPTGNPITPVLKLSSNTHLFNKMNELIDINAGTVISGDDTIETMGEQILDYIIKVASGEIEAKATINGQNDFIPWKRGISL